MTYGDIQRQILTHTRAFGHISNRQELLICMNVERVGHSSSNVNFFIYQDLDIEQYMMSSA